MSPSFLPSPSDLDDVVIVQIVLCCCTRGSNGQCLLERGIKSKGHLCRNVLKGGISGVWQDQVCGYVVLVLIVDCFVFIGIIKRWVQSWEACHGYFFCFT